MSETATHTGDKPILYKLRRVSMDEKARIQALCELLLAGKIDTIIIRKNYKGAGLYIKGLNYTND